MDYQALNALLVEKLNLSKASSSVQDMILMRLGEAIMERTMLTLADTLSEEEAHEASGFLAEGKIENFLHALAERHPELNDEVIAIAEEIIDEFVTTDMETMETV